MVLLTFYAYVGGRNKRIPMLTIDYEPSDWLQLRLILAEVMMKVNRDYGQSKAQIVMERHMPGKFFVKFTPGSYGQRRFRYKRRFQAFFKVSLNPKTGKVEFSRGFFAPNMMHISVDYDAMERNVHYKTPPLVPREHESILENPSLMLVEWSSTRYADYTRTLKPQYNGQTGENQPKHHYNSLAVRQYLPKLSKIAEAS